MKRLMLVLPPLLLYAGAPPDRVTDLLEAMGRLTFAGDQRAVGRIVPALIQELAKPHPRGALAWNQIGVYHAVQGNPTEAEHAYTRGIRLAEQAGTDRGTLALLLVNLALLYLETGVHTGQAEVIARRALELAEKAYDADSGDLADFVHVLGIAQDRSGNRKGARQQLERALLIAGNTREGRIRRGFILGNLVALHMKDRRWNEASDTILEAIALLEQNLEASHPYLVPTYLNLARIQRQFKRWDLASTAVEKARVITETQLGPEHRYMVGILEESAFVLKRTGRHSEARAQARRAKLIAASLQRATAGTWIHVSDLRR